MRSFIRWLAVLCCAVAVVAVSPPAGAQNPIKIGVFSPQRLTEETIEGKRIQTELALVRDRKQKEINDKERAINDLQQQLSPSLSVERRAALELDIQLRLLDLSADKDLSSRELQLEVAAAEALFNDKMAAVVAGFGRDEGFAVILEEGAVAWMAPSVDLTTAIIDRFDEMFPGPAGQGAAAAAPRGN